MPHDFLHQSGIFRFCHGDGAERVPRAIQFQGIRNFELASNTSERVLESAPSEVRTVELSVVSALDSLLGDLIPLDRDSHLPHTTISRVARISFEGYLLPVTSLRAVQSLPVPVD